MDSLDKAEMTLIFPERAKSTEAVDAKHLDIMRIHERRDDLSARRSKRQVTGSREPATYQRQGE